MIRQFIETHLGEGSGRTSIWWREQPGAKSPIDKQKWFQYPDQLDAMAEFAQSKANKDVYMPVSLYAEDKRVPEKATTISAVYQDTDTFDPTGYRLEPSTIVQTSPGRTHCWFVLDKPYPAEQVELVTKKVTYAHRAAGADVSSWGRNKVLRVPGTVNTSHGFPEDISVEYSGAIYTLQEIANAYDDVALPTAAPRVPMPARNTGEIVVPDDRPDLPDFMVAQSKLPATFPLELITSEPEIGSDGNRSQMREKLALECMRAGLTDAETFVVVLNSKCGSEKWTERGDDFGWWEITKFRAIIDLEEGAHATPPSESERKANDPKAPVILLTDAQRARAMKHWDNTFLGEYERYVRSSLKIFNGPYHRAVSWTILATTLGSCAWLRQGKRDIPLNLYIMPIGPTTSGKSEAKAMGADIIHGVFDKENNPDIGDDASQSALSQKLHKRDGKATLLNSDEADGLIGSMVDKGSWKAGILAFWTFLYDGLVPPIMRTGDTDGKWSKTVFNMFLMGTEVGLTSVLTRKMFETGFLARFLWFIGESVDIPEEDLGVREGSIDQALEDRTQINEWGDRWAATREVWMFRKMQPGKEYIRFESPETAEFFRKVTARLEKDTFKNHRNVDIITPSVIRLNRSLWKMAALVAISDNREEISMDDVLLVLLQGEELLGNLVYMAGSISNSTHAQAVDAVEKFLMTQRDHKARVEVIYRYFSSETKYDVDMLLVNLTSQGRAKKTSAEDDNGAVYELRGQ